MDLKLIMIVIFLCLLLIIAIMLIAGIEPSSLEAAVQMLS